MEVQRGVEVRSEVEKSIVVKSTHYVEIQERDSLALVQGQKEDTLEVSYWVIRQRSTVVSPLRGYQPYVPFGTAVDCHPLHAPREQRRRPFHPKREPTV